MCAHNTTLSAIYIDRTAYKACIAISQHNEELSRQPTATQPQRSKGRTLRGLGNLREGNDFAS